MPIENTIVLIKVKTDMNANVTEKIYDNMGHTISDDEINSANRIVFNTASV